MTVMKKTEKRINNRKIPTILGLIVLGFALITNQGCKKDDAPASGYQQVNVVADTVGYGASVIDVNLSNAWGIAIGPTGALWISSNHKGLTTIYNRDGATLLSPISIPFNGLAKGGSPSGVVYNSSTSFVIPANNEISKFIYADENGVINAWSSGTNAYTVVDNSSSLAVYKGIAIANADTAMYIYVANFRGKAVEVYNRSFQKVIMPFIDATIPATFAPFNIQNIGGNLYVTYAKLKAPDLMDDESGVGNGYVDVFSPKGVLLKRFASQGTLNSPWGITQAPAGFGLGSNIILVGNFGDGKINIYDTSGMYKGQLLSGTGTMIIEGLWAIQFPQNGQPTGDQNQLFFTAGPASETHGLFGYVKAR